MKINSIRITNINSLVGSFVIDFDQPPLADCGIFAITGPTGAGKTTILDAIAVALYGQTPRLAAGDCSDLMSRHTGETAAEVEFTVPKGRFRSRFSQRRARGKSDGRLQLPEMELAEYDNGNWLIIGEKKSRVPVLIAEITGLDYHRFTRSVLLAQGGFAAFLNARDNERADLLEKMTGTGIYSLISEESFRRASVEKTKLDEMIAGCAGLKVKTIDEIAEMTEQVARFDHECTTLKARETTLNADLAWLAAIATQQDILAASSLELAAIDRDRQARQADLALLHSARQALGLRQDWSLLTERQTRAAAKKAELATLEQTLPAVAAQVKDLETARLAQEKHFTAWKEEAALHEKKIIAAERLDQSIAAASTILNTAASELNTLAQRLTELHRQEEHSIATLRAIDHQRNEHRARLEANPVDGQLTGDYALLKERLDELAQARLDLITLRRTTEKHHKDITALAERQQQAGKALADLTVASDTLGRRLAELVGQRDTLLAGQRRTDLEAGIESLRESSERLEHMAQTGHETHVTRLRHEKITRDLATAIASTATCREELAAIHRQTEHTERLTAQLIEKQQLERFIAKYEDDRNRLTADSPCPLCGATEHPWAETSPVPDNDLADLISQQKKQADQLRRQENTATANLAALTATHSHLTAERDATELHLQELGSRWQTLTHGESSPLPADCWQEAAERRRLLQEKLAESRQRLTAISGHEETIERLTGQRHSLDKERADRREQLAALTATAHQADADQQRLQQELQQKHIELAARLQWLTEKLIPYDEPPPAAGKETMLIERLRQRLSRFQETGKVLATLAEQRLPLEQAIIRQGEETAQLSKQRDLLTEKIAQQTRAITQLQNERQMLLGLCGTDAERHRLATERTRHEENAHTCATQYAESKEHLTAHHRLTESLSLEIDALNRQITASRSLLATRIKEAGFATEEDFANALISDEDRWRLEDLAQDLTDRTIAASTRQTDAETRLRALREEARSDRDRESLTHELEEAQQSLAQKQDQRGGLRRVLADQESLRQDQAVLLAAIDRQRREHQRWARLNALIGSADGKKFRRYAQSITLDWLITLANRHLLRLNDRYRLVRHQEEELGLEVIDTYQADVRRPTTTLSGGEAFLGSLALALGLAGMASRDTAIDSLFLDEGFGTLDADTLETALSALGSLNTAGKTIGIISHVEALKERIPVQIAVDKKAGGTSTLQILG